MASLLAYSSMILMGQFRIAQSPTSMYAPPILHGVIPPEVVATIAIIMPWTHAPTPPGRSSRISTIRWYGASQTTRPSVSSAPCKIIHRGTGPEAAFQPRPLGLVRLIPLFRAESLCANLTMICISLVATPRISSRRGQLPVHSIEQYQH